MVGSWDVAATRPSGRLLVWTEHRVRGNLSGDDECQGRLVLGPAATTSPESLLEMQVLRPRPARLHRPSCAGRQSPGKTVGKVDRSSQTQILHPAARRQRCPSRGRPRQQATCRWVSWIDVPRRLPVADAPRALIAKTLGGGLPSRAFDSLGLAARGELYPSQRVTGRRERQGQV